MWRLSSKSLRNKFNLRHLFLKHVPHQLLTPIKKTLTPNMKLILGRECNRKKIQEWRQLYYIGTIVLKGHIIFLEGEPYNIPGVCSLVRLTTSLFNDLSEISSFTLKLCSHSEPACLSTAALPRKNVQDLSHFAFHADNGERDKCWYLSALIHLLAQLTVDKDCLKLGQGLTSWDKGIAGFTQN